jgi:hypothetical protein
MIRISWDRKILPVPAALPQLRVMTAEALMG